MSHLNPLSLGSMAKEDVAPGVRFERSIQGDPTSKRSGVFVSEPFFDEHEDIIVQYRFDGDDTVQTIDLCSMGITPNSSGDWSKTPSRFTRR